MRLRHSKILFCDGCFHRIKAKEDTFIVKEGNKHLQVCERCLEC